MNAFNQAVYRQEIKALTSTKEAESLVLALELKMLREATGKPLLEKSYINLFYIDLISEVMSLEIRPSLSCATRQSLVNKRATAIHHIKRSTKDVTNSIYNPRV